MEKDTQDRFKNPTAAQIKAAEELIKTEPYSKYVVMKHERGFLEAGAQQKYGKGYKKYMPLVLLEFIKIKIEQGAPPSGLNRAQRRALGKPNRNRDGTKIHTPGHAYTEKIRVRAIKAKKRAYRARRKAAAAGK